jgi:hypothetical protein
MGLLQTDYPEMSTAKLSASYLEPIARAGLISKGTVYCLLGLLTFMAAFRINGTSEGAADKNGVFDFVQDFSGGQIILGLIAIGLLCYCVWRGIQTFSDSEHKGDNAKGLATRACYLLSGLAYGSMALHIMRILFANAGDQGDQQQDLAAKLLSKPYGEWLVGIGAAILLGIGVYQIYYGLSEKYRKHVEAAGSSRNRDLLLGAGKTGYVARGVVWLLLAWLFFKAAINSDAGEAGGTSKAFAFLHGTTYGTILLGAVGIGLICYGAFNFIRARYEHFNHA